MLSYLVKLAQDSEISASNMGDEEQKSLKELTPNILPVTRSKRFLRNISEHFTIIPCTFYFMPIMLKYYLL